MAEVLASLKKIGGSGEQYTETVLWTNPSPSSTFAAQNVTLSDNLSNYKYIGINFGYSTSNYSTGYHNSTILLSLEDFIKFGYKSGLARCGTSLTVANTNNTIFSRSVLYLNDTSVRFGTCYQVGSSTQENTSAIPLEILGIN